MYDMILCWILFSEVTLFVYLPGIGSCFYSVYSLFLGDSVYFCFLYDICESFLRFYLRSLLLLFVLSFLVVVYFATYILVWHVLVVLAVLHLVALAHAVGMFLSLCNLDIWIEFFEVY